MFPYFTGFFVILGVTSVFAVAMKLLWDHIREKKA